MLGTPVRYQAFTSEEEREQLIGFGLDEGTAAFMVTLNANLRDGAMAPTSGDPARLISLGLHGLEASRGTRVPQRCG
ncbi:hypothetical protein [Streptomyces sp. NBC_01089]|uniref:hypothetical protein n=1 Tax=Streptomyces sp. NBC_01089 TaxID=2903747 RepID=UPI003868D09B|nr:hypothetical protein OG510_26560 [Streptomyces sp. NBC_01089]